MKKFFHSCKFCTLTINFTEMCWQDVLKMSWRLFCKTPKDVLNTSWKRLEDVWPRRIYCSWSRRICDVLKTSSEGVSLRWIYLYWSRRLAYVLKTFSEDENKRRLQDVFKTSSSRQMFAGETIRMMVFRL